MYSLLSKFSTMYTWYINQYTTIENKIPSNIKYRVIVDLNVSVYVCIDVDAHTHIHSINIKG